MKVECQQNSIFFEVKNPSGQTIFSLFALYTICPVATHRQADDDVILAMSDKPEV
jgi:hypothetical protein